MTIVDGARAMPRPSSMPEVMVRARLARDEATGLPVFYTTAKREDGTPDHKRGDPEVRMRCALERRCGYCGEKLAYWMAFLGGKRAVAQRIFADAPGHPECVAYALSEVLPFLMDDLKEPALLGVYATRSFRIAFLSKDEWVFRPAPAKQVDWFVVDPIARAGERAAGEAIASLVAGGAP